MRVVQAPRASAILYNLLMSRQDARPWLLPANICPIVPITLLKSRIPFEFVDISAGTLHMDLYRAMALVETRRFGGLLYAHTYGEASTPDEFFHQIKRLDGSFLIVDDRCLCVPDFSPDADGSVDCRLYSTGYAKIADLGFGGYAFLGDRVSYHPVYLPFDPHAREWIEDNYKKAITDRTVFEYKDCDWLQTDNVMESWDEYRQQVDEKLKNSMVQRNRLNAIYARNLPYDVQLPNAYQLWRFNIRVKNKTKILNEIFSRGLFASSHYASLSGVMAAGQCSQAELLHSQIINLFNDHYFDESRAEKICDVVLENIS